MAVSDEELSEIQDESGAQILDEAGGTIDEGGREVGYEGVYLTPSFATRGMFSGGPVAIALRGFIYQTAVKAKVSADKGGKRVREMRRYWEIREEDEDILDVITSFVMLEAMNG